MNKVFRNEEKRAKGLKNYRYFWNSLITIIGFEIFGRLDSFSLKKFGPKKARD